MLFNSLTFLFAYLPVVVAGFFAFAAMGKRDAAALWLGIASLAFYGFTDPVYLLPIIVGSMAFNFFAGARLAQRPDRGFLIFAVAANLALLGYFKYAGFIVDALPFAIAPRSIKLPIGISFFTFTQIAYLADAYGGKARKYKPHHYLLFVTFFPHLIAGPILHHREMMPQFQDRETYRFKNERFALGLSWFTAGLFKKVVIADSLIESVRAVFVPEAVAQLGFADAWVGALAYALQIYFDFSGYSDMAIGLGLMFGIRLPLNFNSPYRANSIIDFWRRWHMTLSRFLRDYLYVPLGGNRKGRARRYTNLLITMLLGGLWHGAAWTFVLWGAIHGLALTINHLWRDRFGGTAMPAVLGRVLTFLTVLLAWVPFRAADLHEALAIWSAMLRVDSLTLTRIDVVSASWIALLMLAVWTLPNTQNLFERSVAGGFQWRQHWRWACSLGAGFGIAVARIVQGQITEFIYFRF